MQSGKLEKGTRSTFKTDPDIASQNSNNVLCSRLIVYFPSRNADGLE